MLRCLSDAAEQLFVERLDKARIDHRSVDAIVLVQQLSCLERSVDNWANRDECNVRAFAQQFAFPKREDLHWAQWHTDSVPAWIPKRDRTARIGVNRRIEHVPQLLLVFWGHDTEPGMMLHVRKIEYPVMGRAIGTNKASAIECKDNVQMLERNIMDNHVERALEERRVNRTDGDDSFCCHACSTGNRMSLGDANVEDTVWEFLLHDIEPSTIWHRCQ